MALTREPADEATPSDALACWLGRRSVPTLSETYPSLFSRHPNLTSFVLGLGDDLPTVSSGQETDPPVPLSFRQCTSPDGQILLRIEADGAICALVQGVLAGAAAHYREPLAVFPIKSPKHGDNACVLQLVVGAADAAPGSDAEDYRAVGNA